MLDPRNDPPGSSRGLAEWTRHVDAILTRDRLLVYPLMLLALWVVTYVTVMLLDPSRPPLPDFAARWTAGRMLLDGQIGHLYDPKAQSALQVAELGSTTLSWFVSPPFVAAAVAPLSALPYGWACLLWTAISLMCLFAAARLLKPFAPPVLAKPRTLLILLAAAPTLELLGGGQDTSLCLLAVALGIHLLAKNWQVASGVALAVGMIKPHLMLFVPLVLLAQRAIRTIIAFVAAVIGIFAVSWLLVGSAGLLTWLSTPFTPLYSSEVTHGQAWKSPSPGAFLIGLPPEAPRWWLTATTVLALATTILAVLAWRTHRRTVTPQVVWGLGLLTTAVAAPHVMLYDLVFVMPALIALVMAVWDATTRATLALTYVMLWLTSSLHSIATHLSWPWSLVGLPWAALGIFSLWFRFVRARNVPTASGLAP